VDMRLEVVVLPVSEVDRAKEFYVRLGWRLDADFSAGDDFRVVQLTPPGSSCSVIFGTGNNHGSSGFGRRLVPDRRRYRGGARRTRRSWRAGQRRFPRRRRRVPPRRDHGTRAWP
jgi:catechol 2,3-dioxygenase-like lactoylglutathione lyase family enzyme